MCGNFITKEVLIFVLTDEENPFENHFRNVAHDKADKARKDLINEYRNMGKSGGIIDRRFTSGKLLLQFKAQLGFMTTTTNSVICRP